MNDDLSARLSRPRFPRSSTYDPHWMIDNVMGPNPLWLLEWLWPAVDLPPGSRVLDLGCGKALTSIFLAREYGLRVTAADLWIAPSDNWARIHQAGCADQVLPLRAEGHDLPFADEYFDAIVSIDAYHYFGTDDLYLSYLARFLRPGGVVGIAVPGLVADIDEAPAHLESYWEPGYWSFHTADWWQRHWARSGEVDVEVAELMEDSWQEWLLWTDTCVEASDTHFVRKFGRREAEMVRLDAGRTLGFVRIVGRKPLSTIDSAMDGGSAAPPTPDPTTAGPERTQPSPRA